MTKPESARLISAFSQFEIKNLFKIARIRYQSPIGEVRLAPRSLDYGRILIVISRKVGNAVTRNLIRRRIKSIFYQEQLYLYEYDWIIIAKKEMADLSFQALKELLLSIIHAQPTTHPTH